MNEDCKTLDEWLDKILFEERGFGSKADVYEALDIADGKVMMSEAEFLDILTPLLGEEQARCVWEDNLGEELARICDDTNN